MKVAHVASRQATPSFAVTPLAPPKKLDTNTDQYRKNIHKRCVRYIQYSVPYKDQVFKYRFILYKDVHIPDHRCRSSHGVKHGPSFSSQCPASEKVEGSSRTSNLWRPKNTENKVLLLGKAATSIRLLKIRYKNNLKAH